MADPHKTIKTPAYSETIKTEVVCPNDTNPMEILQGGRLVQWMDIAAAVCAQTHADGICVTASIDNVRFYNSAKIGDILTIKARVTRAFSTSMEILVDASVRNPFNHTPKSLAKAYFTFVAIDEHAKKRNIEPLVIQTKEDEKHFRMAAVRKERQLSQQDDE